MKTKFKRIKKTQIEKQINKSKEKNKEKISCQRKLFF